MANEEMNTGDNTFETQKRKRIKRIIVCMLCVVVIGAIITFSTLSTHNKIDQAFARIENGLDATSSEVLTKYASNSYLFSTATKKAEQLRNSSKADKYLHYLTILNQKNIKIYDVIEPTKTYLDNYDLSTLSNNEITEITVDYLNLPNEYYDENIKSKFIKYIQDNFDIVKTSNNSGGYYDSHKSEYTNSSEIVDPLHIHNGEYELGTYKLTKTYILHGDFIKKREVKKWWGTDEYDMENYDKTSYSYRGKSLGSGTNDSTYTVIEEIIKEGKNYSSDDKYIIHIFNNQVSIIDVDASKVLICHK